MAGQGLLPAHLRRRVLSRPILGPGSATGTSRTSTGVAPPHAGQKAWPSKRADSPARKGDCTTVSESARTFNCIQFIRSLGHRLQLQSSTTYLACVLFHRYGSTTTENAVLDDVLCCACIVIASKVEEDLRKLVDVIRCARKEMSTDSTASKLDQQDAGWFRRTIIVAETVVLKELGFRVQITLPHKYLFHQVSLYEQLLGSDVCRSSVVPLSYCLLNDATHDERLCVCVPPDVLAAACLYLAIKHSGLDKDGAPLHTLRWWKALEFQSGEAELQQLSVYLMRLYRREAVDPANTKNTASR